MNVIKIENSKKQYLELLLLADEQEDMIDRYLDRGDMYILTDENTDEKPVSEKSARCYAVCVVTDEGDGILEIKNLAVSPDFQKQGYGKLMIEFIKSIYSENYSILQVGTGDSPATVGFYEKCGFKRAFSVKNFFTDNYDHPIYECGVKLIDMVYFRMSL